MLCVLSYLIALFLLWQAPATALPQLALPSTQLLSTTAAVSTGPSATIEESITLTTLHSDPQPIGTADTNNHKCDFEDMQDFFDHATRDGLNITVEVQNCQNLCLLTYGVGNPDLSGIGMMYAYSIQTGLTILIGPAYRLLYLLMSGQKKSNIKSPLFLSFIEKLRHVQDLFFASNGFFILASAVASLVSLSQSPAIFEIAEMQSLAFLQVNSILVTFFCLVDSLSLFNARVLLHAVVFVVVIVALGRSQLSSTRRMNWRLASDGCAHGSTDYGVITPVPYPSWAAAIFAVMGMVAFWLMSLKEKFKGSKARALFRLIMFFWILLLGLMIAGMIIGVSMMWRQRRYLRSVAGDQFEDDVWGFGQVAALFVWAPIPLSLLGVFYNCAQNFPNDYWKSPVIKYFLVEKTGIREEHVSPDSQTDEKKPTQAGTTVKEVSDVRSPSA